MHLGGKCKISWSNDDLERFLKVRALLSDPRGPWQIGLNKSLTIRKQGVINSRNTHAP